MKILLVDDDQVLGRALTRLLVAEGHEVITAKTYEEAVLLGQQPQIQAIITDYHLNDGKTGADVIKAVGGDRPFLLMSGDMKVVPYSFREKAFATVDKPFPPSELRALAYELSTRA